MHCMILGMNYSLRIGITGDSGNQCSHAVSIGNNRESLRRNGRTGIADGSLGFTHNAILC